MKFVFGLMMFLTAPNSRALAAEIKLISVGTVSPVLHEQLKS